MKVDTLEIPGNKAPLAGNTNTGLLKLIALLLMMTDHIGCIFFPGVMELRMIGRMALPLYAWCLIVGTEHTRDIRWYALRLLLLAVLSQPLYCMALGHELSYLNILFLLFLAVCAIGGIRLNRFGSRIWAPMAAYVVLGLVKVDYGWKGLTFILLLYAVRKNRSGIAAVFIAFGLFWGTGTSVLRSFCGIPLDFLNLAGMEPIAALFRLQAMIWLSLPLVLIPMPGKVYLPRLTGYLLYPAHLILLILLRMGSGISFQTLTHYLHL